MRVPDRPKSAVSVATHRLGFLRAAVLTLLPLFLLGAVADRAEALTPRSGRFHAWVDSCQAYFDANPTLKDSSGTGWNIFQRLKDLNEERMHNGELPPVAARWDAVQSAIAKSATLGSPGPTWNELAPEGAENENGLKVAGRTVELEFDPFNSNRIYAASAGGGVWLSTNSGADWSPIGDGLASLPVGAIGVSKKTPGLLLAGTGEAYFVEGAFYAGVGILRSTDDGATWSKTQLAGSDWPQADGSVGFHFIECGPDNVFLAGGNKGIYISSDAGENWSVVNSIPSGGHGYDARWKPGIASSTVYVTRGNSDIDGDYTNGYTPDGFDGVWKSTNIDGAATFTQLSVGITMDIGKSRMDVVAAAPQSVYVIFSNPGLGLGNGGGGGDSELWITTDDGVSWARPHSANFAPVNNQLNYDLALAVDPLNPGTIFLGDAADDVVRSTDSGVTWQEFDTSDAKDQHCLIYDPGNSSTLWLACDTGVWRSTTGGTSGWVPMNQGLATLQFYKAGVRNGPTHSSSPRWVAGGTQDNGLFQWRATTPYWEPIRTPPDGSDCAFDPVTGADAYAEYRQGELQQSSDAGVTWANNDPASGLTGPIGSTVDVSLDRRVYRRNFNFVGNRIETWAPGETDWTDLVGSNHPPRSLSASPASADTVWWISPASVVQLTPDGGVSVVDRASPMATTFPNCIRAHPHDNRIAFVTYSGYPVGAVAPKYIQRTTDSGANWEDVTGDFASNPHPVNSIAINPSNPDHWYIATDTGIWRSTNEGVNWNPYGTDLPRAYALEVEIQDDLQRVLAITHGRGVWEADIMESGADVVWSGSVYVDKDYVVPVGAKLTIESGTDVSTVDGAQIIIEGELVAEGTGVSGTEIILGKVPAATTWGGLVIAASGQFTLDPLATGTVLDIRDASEGITFAPAATFDDISHIAFSGNTVDAVFEEEIVVASSTQESIASDLVIEIQDDVVIQSNGTLDIAQGVTIQANDVDTGDGDTIGMSVEGVLSALGDPANRVRLTSVAATPGSWDGIEFLDASDMRLSAIEYVDIEYPDVGVRVDSLACTLLEPSVTGASTAEYWVDRDTHIKPGVEWSLVAPDTVTVAADVGYGGSGGGDDPNLVEILVRGIMRTDGTATERVVFQSEVQNKATSGDWQGLSFASTSIANLNYGEFSYAETPLAFWSADTAIVRNSVISRYSVDGILAFASNVVIQDCEVIRGEELLAPVSTTGIHVVGDGVQIIGGTVGGQTDYGIWVDYSKPYCESTPSPSAPDTMRISGTVCAGLYETPDGLGLPGGTGVYVAWVCHEKRVELEDLVVSNWQGGMMSDVGGVGLALSRCGDVRVECCQIHTCRTGFFYRRDDTKLPSGEEDVELWRTSIVNATERGVLAKRGVAGLVLTSGTPQVAGENLISRIVPPTNETRLFVELKDLTSPATLDASDQAWKEDGAFLTAAQDVLDECEVGGGAILISPLLASDPNCGPNGALIGSAQTGVAVDDPTLVSETERQDGRLPSKFSLTGVLPNPFFSSATVKFEVPAGLHQSFSLSVYDVRGRRVRDLVRGPISAGRHELVWDGRDKKGKALAAGVYFVQLKSVDGVQTEKVVFSR